MLNDHGASKRAFRLLAQVIDDVGEEKTTLFLARLALILSDEINDHARFESAVARALKEPAAAEADGPLPVPRQASAEGKK